MLAVYILGVICLLGIGLSNFLIDPYLFFESPRFDGINRWKTRFFWHQLETKSNLVRDAGIDTLIVGTSTAGDSLNPQHPAFREARAFNFAIAGSTPRVQRLAFAHAMRSNPIRSLVVCIDQFAYNEYLTNITLENWATRFVPTHSKYERWMRWRQSIEAHLAKLFSWPTLSDTIATLESQDARRRDDIRANGFWIKPRLAKSQYGAFEAIERYYLTAGWFPDPARRFALGTEAGHQKLDELRELLAGARDAGVSVTIAIMPSHARFNEAMHEARLWDDFDELKRQLVRLVNERSLSDMRIPVWDFSGYNSIGMDPVKDAALETPWFKDSIHPTAATGKLMFDRMFVSGQSSTALPEDFGRKLTAKDLESQLVEATTRRDEYLRMNKVDVEDIRRLATQTRNWRATADPTGR